MKLLKNNLEKTKFKSACDAELFIDEMISNTKKMEKENKRLYELLEKANVEQRHHIF